MNSVDILGIIRKEFGRSLNYSEVERLLKLLDENAEELGRGVIIEKQKQFWNEFADYYLHRHHKVPFVQDHWNKVLDLLEINEEDDILDLACGAGRLADELLKKKIGFKNLIGLDYASGMLALAKRVFADEKKIRFTEADLADGINLPDKSISKCVSNWGITYLPKAALRTALKEIHRVLKPNGVFVCSSLVKGAKLSSRLRKLKALPEIFLQNKWSVVKEASLFEKRIRLLFSMYDEKELFELMSSANMMVAKQIYTIAGGSLAMKSNKI